MEVKIDHEWSTFLKIFEKFFCTDPAGYSNCVSMFAPNGAAPFLHRLSGARELPLAGSSLTGGSFSAPADRGTRTASACSPFPGGEFFAELQRGVALCGAREVAAPAAGATPYPRRWAKRKGHLRFPFLFELLPFPCFLIQRRFPICDRFEKEYGSRVTAACLSQPVRRVRYRTATHMGNSTLGAA